MIYNYTVSMFSRLDHEVYAVGVIVSKTLLLTGEIGESVCLASMTISIDMSLDCGKETGFIPCNENKGLPLIRRTEKLYIAIGSSRSFGPAPVGAGSYLV